MEARPCQRTPKVHHRLLVIDGFLARTTQCMCVFTARTMLDVESCRRRQLHLGSNFGPQNGLQNLPQNWRLENANKKEMEFMKTWPQIGSQN